MRLYEIGSIVFGLVLVILFGIGVFSHQFLGNDNKLEETIEKVIKEETGLNVDLTPESKEAEVKE